MSGETIFTLIAIILGIINILFPQFGFYARHWFLLKEGSGLSKGGLLLWRIGGIFSLLVGIMVLLS